MLGLYVHVPFCAKKCPYCDFYSVPWRIPKEDAYLNAILRDFAQYKERKLAADTLYFGGGTPSLIRPQTISTIIDAAKQCFVLTDDAEITMEANPCTVTAQRAKAWADAGINRVSLGMQSMHSDELKLLGRSHRANGIVEAVSHLRDAGINNISLDIMMALPHQTQKQVMDTIDFAASLQVEHISAYMLQIEEGTPFAESEEIAFCPTEEETAELYLAAVEHLEACGYPQYEISNFAKPGYQSRHNNKYWLSVDYLGFGPAAHSCFEGKRFSYPADLDAYVQSGEIEYADSVQDAEEYAMLRLRLTEGLCFEDYRNHGGDADRLKKQCQKYKNSGLLCLDDAKITLTAKGFLLSNALIADLLG